jgi:hypothetical protein
MTTADTQKTRGYLRELVRIYDNRKKENAQENCHTSETQMIHLSHYITSLISFAVDVEQRRVDSDTVALDPARDEL